MRSRAYRVALKALDEEKKILDDAKIKATIKDALDTLYPVYIGRYLKNIDMKQLTKMMYILVHQFDDSGSAEQLLSHELETYHRKILRILYNIAHADNNSIKEEVFQYFKKNPTSDEDDIENYMREMLRDIVYNTKRQSNKWRQTV